MKKFLFIFLLLFELITNAQDYHRYYSSIDSAKYYRDQGDSLKAEAYYHYALTNFKGFPEDYEQAILLYYRNHRELHMDYINRGFACGMWKHDLKYDLKQRNISYKKRAVRKSKRQNKIHKTVNTNPLLKLLIKDQKVRRGKNPDPKKMREQDSLTALELIRLHKENPDLFNRLKTKRFHNEMLWVMMAHMKWEHIAPLFDDLHKDVEKGNVDRFTMNYFLDRNAVYRGVSFKFDTISNKLAGEPNLTDTLCNKELGYSVTGNFNNVLGAKRKPAFAPMNPSYSQAYYDKVRHYLFLPPLKLDYSNKKYEDSFVSEEEYCKLVMPDPSVGIWNIYHTPEEIASIYKQGIDARKRTSSDDAAWESSFIGDIQNTLKYANLFFAENEKYINQAYKHPENLRSVDAKKYILEATKERQVVMINELHDLPYHRVFTAELLKEMYDMGFRYFGAEAIRNDSLNERKFPTTRSGFYLHEPQYSNLVRYALQLGYTVFEYEKRGGEKDRELAQAENIYSIIQKNPGAKILVHVGAGHIREDTLYGKLMAARFKEISGIDPFTVNQGKMSEQSYLEYECREYEKLAPLNTPVIYFDKKTNLPVYDSITDLTVFHPRTKITNDRSQWIYTNKRYKKLKVENKFGFTESHLILAYLKSEYDSDKPAVPVDIVAMKDGSYKAATLLLPFDGKYVIVFKSSKRVWRYTTEIK